VALPLAHELASPPEDQDPVAHLALRATSKARFLDVDANLVRLLEAAVGRAGSDEARARVLARLARELLGDAAAAAHGSSMLPGPTFRRAQTRFRRHRLVKCDLCRHAGPPIVPVGSYRRCLRSVDEQHRRLTLRLVGCRAHGAHQRCAQFVHVVVGGAVEPRPPGPPGVTP
jgi:hypothetical protein